MASFSVVFVVLVVGLVRESSGDQCLTPGRTFSLEHEFDYKEDVYRGLECREMCLQDSSCNGFTWYDEEGHPYPWTCHLFSNSTEEYECRDCMGGDRSECTCANIDEQCVVQADSNNLLNTLAVSSELECKNVCQELLDCEFYTWFGESNPLQTMCFLFSSCDEVVACSGCSSGRPTCQPHTPQQCQQYWLLDDPTRNVEGGYEEEYCDGFQDEYDSPDWKGQGWYRMIEPAGKQIPEETPGAYHCGTSATGWLNGSHPQFTDATFKEMVCFDYGQGPTSICDRNVNVEITNCGDFFVYLLPEVPSCYLRYCSA